VAIAVEDCKAANCLIDRDDRCCDKEHGVRVCIRNGRAHRVQKGRSAAVEQAPLLLLRGSNQHGRRALRGSEHARRPAALTPPIRRIA
jgi:hypothetical protein